MKKYLLLAFFLFTTLAHAQTQVSIQKPTAQVYASPSTTSEVLVVLKKGSKVDVAGVTETGWAKIKVTVSGFQFEGWVKKDAILKPKTPATTTPRAIAKKPTAPKAAPKSNLSSSSSKELEQFFEPSSQPSSSSSFTPAPAPEPVARVEEKPKKEKKTREPSSGGNWKTDKLILSGSPGFAIHQYTFSDSTRDAFRYNLTGISAILGAEYKAFNFFDDLIRMSAQFQGQYVMFNTKTNLLDGTNTQFSDLTAKNAMMDLWFKLKFMVNFERIMSKPMLVGVSGGYQYMRFFGDDIVDDNDEPVGLYVDQTTKSIPVGVIAELHFLDPVTMTIGADVLIKNSAKEGPALTSGSNPKAKMGYAPYLYLNFPIVGENHFMGIRYNLRLQETTFTGPSTTRVNNELTDATSLHVFHTLGLEYAYHF